MKKSILLILFVLSCCFPILAREIKTDICVYGGSASGVSAAIQAARLGNRTVLITESSHIGGMVTSGLTATDLNRQDVIGGIAAEFYGHIYDYYLKPGAWKNQTRDEYMISTKKRTYSGKNDARKIQWVYESGVAETILKEMLDKAGVNILYNSRIDLQNGVSKKGKDINKIRLDDGRIIKAKVFIDASYEGDLMALAGVSNTIGRESKAQYGEQLAGMRLGYTIKTSPYLNKQSGILIPFVDSSLGGKEGDADARIQAYCYRVTLTDDKDNMIPITCPKGYDSSLYELLARQIEGNPSIELKDIISFTPMPNRKTDTNHLDFIGGSFDYPSGNYLTRAAIAESHKNFAIGMLWFLGNDPRVPERLRNEMKLWGWPKDDFVDNGNFPFQLYVREARRMIGKYIMTEKNIRPDNREDAGFSVGVASYAFDCHYVRNVVGPDGDIRGEGTIFAKTAPYVINYYSLTPKEEECGNLLVTVCMSASHVAYSSIRMEPVFMVLGQSAAVAASIAIKDKKTIQEIDYEKLKSILISEGQILKPLEQ
jgi:hypothetical protein